MTRQELVQTMPRPLKILPSLFPKTPDVPHAFLFHGRRDNNRQNAHPSKLRQFDRIQPIGFHMIRRGAPLLRRRDNRARNAQFLNASLQVETACPRFVITLDFTPPLSGRFLDQTRHLLQTLGAVQANLFYKESDQRE